MALQQNQINLEDAIDIREIKNLKLANQLLKVKRKAKEQRDEDNKAKDMHMQSQLNIQSSQAAAQSKMQAIQAETQSKIQIQQATIAFEIEKLKSEANLKHELMQREFDMNMALKGVEQDGLRTREESREESKDRRIGIQNTQQSKLIQQRKDNLPPINFESNEDSLDGFDLAQFEPR